MIKVIAMMFVFAVAGTTAATSAFSGTWVGTFNASGSDHSVPQVLIFNQQGSKLTGSGGPDTVERYPIAKGHVENGQASFELTTSRGITFVYKLRKTGGELNGKLDIRQGSDTTAATVSLKLHAK